MVDTDGSAAGWPALQFAPCDHDHVQAITPDGRYLAWSASGVRQPTQGCLAQGKYVVDRTTGVAATARNLAPFGGAGVVGISEGARAVLFMDVGTRLPGGDGDIIDVYLRDRVRNTTVRQDFSVAAELPDEDVLSAVLSDDGTKVAFRNCRDEPGPQRPERSR